MSSKSKRKNTRRKSSMRKRPRTNATPVRTSTKTKSQTIKKIKKPKSLIQHNPKLAAIVLIVTYFLLDYLMMNPTENIHMSLIVIFTLLASSALYSYYAADYHKELNPAGGTDMPKYIKNKKKYAVLGWFAITVWGIIFLVVEPFIVPRFFPVLDNTYQQSQIVMMLFIAPVVEEIIFRYLLYDRWLRRKWGKFWGFMVASLIFVICHPVTNMHSLIIYWAPTILFFMVYYEFGLYGAIVMHMIYNMMAI